MKRAMKLLLLLALSIIEELPDWLGLQLATFVAVSAAELQQKF